MFFGDSSTDIITKIDTNNVHLCFYGKVCNFSEKLINHSNGYIMLGASGDYGKYQLMDILINKEYSDLSLDLDTFFFIFKNKMYTTHIGNGTMLDYSNDVVILNDGTVGWGGTFYPFHVIIDPHPNLNLNKDIIIESPLCYTICHDKQYKCCIATEQN